MKECFGTWGVAPGCELHVRHDDYGYVHIDRVKNAVCPTEEECKRHRDLVKGYWALQSALAHQFGLEPNELRSLMAWPALFIADTGGKGANS